MRQWRRVLFTDESRFTLFRPDGHAVYTDAAEKALLMFALSNGIDLGVARLWSGEGLPMG